MIIKDDSVLLAVGMISLAIAIGLRSFGPDSSIIHFLEGMFIGISLVLNLAFLIRYRLKRSRKRDD
jgi:hypothetical protein